jgi:hypothetical protein
LLASLDGLTSEHDRRIDAVVNELFGEEEDDELDRLQPAPAPIVQDEQQTVEPAEPAEPTAEPTVPDGHDPQLRGGATMDNYPTIPAIDDSIVYASCELAEAAVHAHSLKAGYEVIRPNGGKVNGVGQIRLIPFKCANFKAPLVRKEGVKPLKDKHSKRTGCAMPIALSAVDANDTQGRWKTILGKSHGSHNHPAVDAIGLASHRRRARTSEVGEFLLHARSSGISPKGACSMAVQQFSGDNNARLVLRDVYNEWARIRSRDLAKKTPIERVLECLLEDNFFVKPKRDGDRLEGLFFTHPELIQIYKDNGDILALNCTYSTNAYKLPLLCIVFITRVGVTIPLAHVVMPGESEEDYNWAFDCFNTLYEEYGLDDPSVLLRVSNEQTNMFIG